MTDIIASRNDILDQMVALRNRYAELRTLQSTRLDAISLSAVPDPVGLGVERIVMAEEVAVIEEFLRLASTFPAHVASVQTATVMQPRSGLLGFIKGGHEVLVEVESPEVPEARLQEARIVHLLAAFSEDLSERRAALQHASYTIKRVVVGLNQSAEISIEEDATRRIERDRHGLEGLVSLVDRTANDIVLALRRVGDVSDARPPMEKPAPVVADEVLRIAG